MHLRLALVMVAFVSTAVMTAAGCTSESPRGEPPCVTRPEATCRPSYDPPTFATIHSKILAPNCATGGGSCHTSSGAKAGLVLADPDQSYALLRGENGAHVRVLPGDPNCSLLMKRVASTDSSYRMPPGSAGLSEGDLCTIRQWIANGAAR